jgi:hypothetical protein
MRSRLTNVMHSKYLPFVIIILHLILLLSSWPLAKIHSDRVIHDLKSEPTRFAGIEVLDDTPESSLALILWGLIPCVYLPAIVFTTVIWGSRKVVDPDSRYIKLYPIPVFILSIVYLLLWLIL